MQIPPSQHTVGMKKGWRISVIIGLSLLGLVLVVVALIYFWPLQSKTLQTSPIEQLTYQQAVDRVTTLNQQETAEGVLSNCHSKLHTHGAKTTKAVVILHGVTACPKEFAGLAQKFYDNGYNVYVPLTPHHGLPNNREHGKVTAKELTDYVTTSLNIATGLGDERGVIGLSGGGMLATWAAEYRPDVKHLLMLSPFYEPATAKAPKWLLPLLYVLYGKHILPDRFVEPSSPGDAAFSYAALANYGIVSKNIQPDHAAPGLKTIGLVTSSIDDQIDLDQAKQIPARLAKASSLSLQQTVLPADWHIIHDIVDQDSGVVAAHKDYLFDLYFNHYEGS